MRHICVLKIVRRQSLSEELLSITSEHCSETWMAASDANLDSPCLQKENRAVACVCAGKKKRHHTSTALFPAQELQRGHKRVTEGSASSGYHKPETDFHSETRTLFWACAKLMQWQIHRRANFTTNYFYSQYSIQWPRCHTLLFWKADPQEPMAGAGPAHWKYQLQVLSCKILLTWIQLLFI